VLSKPLQRFLWSNVIILGWAEGETLVVVHKGLQSVDSNEDLNHSNLQRSACCLTKNLEVSTVERRRRGSFSIVPG